MTGAMAWLEAVMAMRAIGACCHCCWGKEFWQHRDGRWLCANCCPPVPGSVMVVSTVVKVPGGEKEKVEDGRLGLF